MRRAFDKPELSYDYALVSMELSQVLLEQGETVRVRAIAEETFSIFRRQEVPVETLKALRIFCEAARQETATVELARRIVGEVVDELREHTASMRPDDRAALLGGNAVRLYGIEELAAARVPA